MFRHIPLQTTTIRHLGKPYNEVPLIAACFFSLTTSKETILLTVLPPLVAYIIDRVQYNVLFVRDILTQVTARPYKLSSDPLYENHSNISLVDYHSFWVNYG